MHGTALPSGVPFGRWSASFTPPIFADGEAKTSEDVKRRWDEIKTEELQTKDKPRPKGLLDGVPRSLPALVEAQQIASRAAGAGFDWPNVSLVLDKLHEELAELEEARASGGALDRMDGLYQGGAEYSTIRQSKETLAQRRLDLATTHDKARAAVVEVWGELQAAKAQIQAAREEVRAAEVALNGVRMEARLGMRTTLDVLIDQQAMVNAQVNLVTAQRDRVVGSYDLLSAIGRLSPQTLGLATSIYEPMVHYQQVRDAWRGVRTPDGR